MPTCKSSDSQGNRAKGQGRELEGIDTHQPPVSQDGFAFHHTTLAEDTEARLLCQRQGVSEEDVAHIWQPRKFAAVGEELEQIYGLLIKALQKVNPPGM